MVLEVDERDTLRVIWVLVAAASDGSTRHWFRRKARDGDSNKWEKEFFRNMGESFVMCAKYIFQKCVKWSSFLYYCETEGETYLHEQVFLSNL